MLRVLIIEDSDEDYRDIRNNLYQFFRRMDIPLNVTRLTSADRLESGATRHELIFLDTNPQCENGVEVARYIRKRDAKVPIVLVSSNEEEASLGYGVDAKAFLKKPIDPAQFAMAMRRIMKGSTPCDAKPIAIKTSGTMLLVNPSDLAYVTVDGHNLTFYLHDGTRLTDVRYGLSRLEKSLNPRYFARISKSCLVGLAYVDAVHGQSVTMLGGETFPISRVYSKTVRQALARHYGED